MSGERTLLNPNARTQPAKALTQGIEQLPADAALLGGNGGSRIGSSYIPDLRNGKGMQPRVVTRVYLLEKSKGDFMPCELLAQSGN